MIHGDEHVLVLGSLSYGFLDAEDPGAAAGISDLGAGEVGSGGGKVGGVDIRREFHVLGVMIEEGLAAGIVREVHVDDAVEAAGPSESGVNVVGAVGGGDGENAAFFLEAIEEGEKLGDKGALA